MIQLNAAVRFHNGQISPNITAKLACYELKMSHHMKHDFARQFPHVDAESFLGSLFVASHRQMQHLCRIRLSTETTRQTVASAHSSTTSLGTDKLFPHSHKHLSLHFN
jgi:hypothetical protein